MTETEVLPAIAAALNRIAKLIIRRNRQSGVAVSADWRKNRRGRPARIGTGNRRDRAAFRAPQGGATAVKTSAQPQAGHGVKVSSGSPNLMLDPPVLGGCSLHRSFPVSVTADAVPSPPRPSVIFRLGSSSQSPYRAFEALVDIGDCAERPGHHHCVPAVVIEWQGFG
jgi:hypothetical protein